MRVLMRGAAQTVPTSKKLGPLRSPVHARCHSALAGIVRSQLLYPLSHARIRRPF